MENSVGALWEKTKNKDDNKLQKYFVGKMDNIAVLLFENKKLDKNDPDLNILQKINNETGDFEKELINLGSLWKKTSKNGNEYYTGYFRGSNIVVFKNNYKKEEKHPDFFVYLDNRE